MKQQMYATNEDAKGKSFGNCSQFDNVEQHRKPCLISVAVFVSKQTTSLLASQVLHWEDWTLPIGNLLFRAGIR
jgi:hypothetical protein